MDLNVNELPETTDARLKPDAVERAVQPEPRDGARMIKIAGFLAVVAVLTTLAINSHQGPPPTMASDTPPAVAGATTLPTIAAPTDRATTGAAPGIAPNAPSEPNRAATAR